MENAINTHAGAQVEAVSCGRLIVVPKFVVLRQYVDVETLDALLEGQNRYGVVHHRERGDA